MQSIAAGWRAQAQARAEARSALGQTMAFTGHPYRASPMLPPPVQDEFDDETFAHFKAVTPHHAAGRSAALNRVIGAGEIAAGLAVTAAGGAVMAAGIATTPDGIGIPYVLRGAALARLGAAMTADGIRRLGDRDEGFTAHPEQRPTPPPVLPLPVPPIEGFDPHPVAEKPKLLATPLPVPVEPVPEGLVPPQPITVLVLPIYGDGQPDMIHTPKQDRHTPGLQTDPGRSTLTHPDPQHLLDAHTGQGVPTGSVKIRGQQGFKETFDAGVEIGIYRNNLTGEVVKTTRGTIHYNKRGAHIVPAPPPAPQGSTQP